MKLERQSLLWLFLLMAVLLFLRFPDFFRSPNTKVIEPWGDGFKAYTVIDYHVKWDSTYSHFEGMNYPYGEHVIPAATQPFISNTLKWIGSYIPGLKNYTIGIINWSLLLGLLLSSIFLFLILKKLGVDEWPGILTSIGLTFLAPQFLRFTSHYGLAHVEVIPILLYLLLSFEAKPKLKTSIWIGIVITIYAAIHFYFFAINLFMVSFYFAFKALRHFNISNLLRLLGHYSLQILVPLSLFYLWLYYDDQVLDRCKAPWGFFYFRAYYYTILTSDILPHFKPFFNNNFFTEPFQFEGKVYIGLVPIISVPVIIFYWLFRKVFFPEGYRFQKGLFNLLNAATLLLLFSFGLPFTLEMFKDLFDFAGPIRQFRSIGRFAWMFYFVINLFVFSWWYHTLQGKWKNLIYLPILILLLEAFLFSTSPNLKLDPVARFEKGDTFPEIPGIDYSRYQAIVTVPHFNIGSDNFWYAPEGFILQNALTLSTQTGLPTTSAMLTRTSLGQTINQIQLLMEPYRAPNLLDDLTSPKPFLMVVDKKYLGIEFDKYAHLLSGSSLLFESDRLQLFELPLSSFQDRMEEVKKQLLIELEFDSLNPISPFLSNKIYKDFYYNSFDSSTNEIKYAGHGGLQFNPKFDPFELEINPPLAQKDSMYQLSFWTYINEDLAPRTEITLQEINPANRELLQQFNWQLYTQCKVFDDNGWALVETSFKLKAKDSILKLKLENTSMRWKDLFIDELLLKPKNTNLYQQNALVIWKNNRFYER